jgi:hypothetical protein
MEKTTYPKISFYDFWHIINNNNPEQGLIYLENLIAEGNSDYFEEGSEDHPDSPKVSDFLRSGKLYDYLKEKFNSDFCISVFSLAIIVKPDNSSKYYYIGKEPILASPEFRNRLLSEI